MSPMLKTSSQRTLSKKSQYMHNGPFQPVSEPVDVVHAVRSLLALSIMNQALNGETDPVRLKKCALLSLGVKSSLC